MFNKTVDEATEALIKKDPKDKPKYLQVELVPVGPVEYLEQGESLIVEVRLSTSRGRIRNVRRLQFDTSKSTGLQVNSFQWDIDGVSSDYYYADGNQEVDRINYIGWNRQRGYILDITRAPVTVGRYNITLLDRESYFSVIGSTPANSPPDDGLQFEAGFGWKVKPWLPYHKRDGQGDVRGGWRRFLLDDEDDD